MLVDDEEHEEDDEDVDEDEDDMIEDDVYMDEMDEMMHYDDGGDSDSEDMGHLQFQHHRYGRNRAAE